MRQTRPAVMALVVALAGFALLAGLAGCSRDALLDERNIYYIRGMKLREAKKNEEAVEAFQTCLRLSPQSALAHLQLALIYDEPLDDPLSAVYHYRRFLEMRPDHPDAEAVRGWVAKTEQNLLRRLQQAAVYAAIGQGDETASPQTDGASPTARELALLARIQELTGINEDLRQAMAEPIIEPGLLPPPAEAPAAAVATVATPPERIATGTASVPPARTTAADTPAASVPTAGPAPRPAAASTPAASDPPQPGPASTIGAGASAPSRPAAATPAAPSAPAGARLGTGGTRTHVVVAGDTLSSLCRRYYGNTSFWPQLQQANRDLLGARNDLKVGMRLRIPALSQLRPPTQTPTRSR